MFRVGSLPGRMGRTAKVIPSKTVELSRLLSGLYYPLLEDDKKAGAPASKSPSVLVDRLYLVMSKDNMNSIVTEVYFPFRTVYILNNKFVCVLVES